MTRRKKMMTRLAFTGLLLASTAAVAATGTTDIQKTAEKFAADMGLKGKVVCHTEIKYNELLACSVGIEAGVTGQITLLVCTATECSGLGGAVPDPVKAPTTTK